MRHLKAGRKLGRNPAHRRATLRNLVTNLLEHDRIITTMTRAKAMRPIVEHMITLGKQESLHARRQAASYITHPPVVAKLFETIAPRYADRAGGYTRIIPAGFGKGDGRAIAIIELLGAQLRKRQRAKDKEKVGKK
jgi:large subunit ribosomal protein L17